MPEKSGVGLLVYMSMLTALSLSLFVLEGLLPVPFLAPGAKLGLANIVTLMALYFLKPQEALTVLVLRLLLAAAFAGGLGALAYSAAGGLVAFAVMLALKISGRFSMPAVSAAGGFFHNAAQLVVACLIQETVGLFAYLAVLGPLGLATGLLTGWIADRTMKRLAGYNTGSR